MSKGFQECRDTGSNLNFNEVVKTGLNGKMTFQERLEGGEGMSYMDIKGTTF